MNKFKKSFNLKESVLLPDAYYTYCGSMLSALSRDISFVSLKFEFQGSFSDNNLLDPVGSFLLKSNPNF